MPVMIKDVSRLAFALAYRQQIALNEKAENTFQNQQNEPLNDSYDQKGGLNHLSFGLGYQANKSFSIGTSYHISVNSKLDLNEKEFDEDEESLVDTEYKFHYMTLSMLGKLGNHIELGLAYRSEYILNTDTKDNSETDQDQYSSHILMPEEWTVGISMHNNYLKLNAEYVLPYYMRYNTYLGIPIFSRNGNKFRIGAEGIAKKFIFRAGTYHEDVISPLTEIQRQIGYTFGLGIKLHKNTSLDFAADFCSLDEKNDDIAIEYKTQRYLLGLSMSY